MSSNQQENVMSNPLQEYATEFPVHPVAVAVLPLASINPSKPKSGDVN